MQRIETRPTSVLDASALLALLHDEPGAEAAAEAVVAGTAISVFNWAEALSKVAANGDDPALVAEWLGTLAVGESVIWLDAPNAEDCIAIGNLRPVTRSLGLSLADRACLVLAERLGVPALTTDRNWTKADVASEVRLIR